MMRRFLSERMEVWRAASERHWLYWAIAAFMLTPLLDLVDQLISTSRHWQTPLWVWATMVAGFVLAVAFSEHALGLTRKLAPALKMQFLPDNGGIVHTKVALTSPSGLGNMPVMITTWSESMYVRVRVDSIGGTAPRSCAAFLTKLRRRSPSGEIEDGRLYDGMQLPWSVTSVGAGEIQLAPRIPRHFDVCQAAKDGEKLQLMGGVPFTLDNFFDPVAVYLFTVAVVADGQTQDLTFGIAWNGKWNEIREAPV